jgi:eukaryotic-like serine/threonine-protein kinase
VDRSLEVAVERHISPVETSRVSLAHAPLRSEDAAALVQQRVSLLARVELILGLCIQAVVVLVHLASPGSEYATGSSWTVYAHLLVPAALAAIWWRTRTGRRAALELGILDVACVAIPCAFSAVALWEVPLTVRPSQIFVLSATQLLILRAILVPGTGRRSAMIGAAASFLIGAWTYLHHRHHGAADQALLHGGLIMTWCVMGGVVIAAVASHTIFGLRQRVRDAMQVGQYRLLRKIGEGGMGVVWEARHALLRRRTAVKLLPADRAGEEAIVRFEREVQLTSALTHPNTIAVYDYGRSADGLFYYAMEYLDGIDLQALVERGGPQEAGLVVHVLRQICDALAEAHAVGLIHRDVKPANVILCERGGVPLVAKVLDFGLVKLVDAGGPSAQLSVANAVVGTPLYMAPEAMATPDRVDARVDLYAVGAVGYYLLTGRPVFEGTSILEVIAHHLQTRPARPSDRLGAPVARDLEELILECLEKNQALRPATAAALSERLAATEAARTWSRQSAATAWERCRSLRRRSDQAEGVPVEPTLLAVAQRS